MHVYRLLMHDYRASTMHDGKIWSILLYGCLYPHRALSQQQFFTRFHGAAQAMPLHGLECRMGLGKEKQYGGHAWENPFNIWVVFVLFCGQKSLYRKKSWQIPETRDNVKPTKVLYGYSIEENEEKKQEHYNHESRHKNLRECPCIVGVSVVTTKIQSIPKYR